MSDDRNDGMKMVGLSGGKKFFVYEEPQERTGIYLVLPGQEEKGSFLDDIDFLDMEREETTSFTDTERYGEILDESLDDVYGDELTNPIKHYIKEMGGVALLTREGEKEIAMRIEQARADVKRIILSVPLTIKELVRALPALESGKMDLKEITSEVDEEEDTSLDADVQRDMIIALLENLKEK